MAQPSPDPSEVVIPTRDPCARITVRRVDPDTVDIRVARRSPHTDPRFPENWHLTLAGFRCSRIAAVELRGALRELLGI